MMTVSRPADTMPVMTAAADRNVSRRIGRTKSASASNSS
jgi:hypothetical protein